MNGWTILALVAVFVVACAAIGYACFAAGHALGYHQRGIDMTLPESARNRYRDVEPRWRTLDGQ